MDVRLDKIMIKPQDFKLCKTCGDISWYKNTMCRDCGSNEFKSNGEGIVDWAKMEYEFWEKVEGYSEDEADDVIIEV